MLQLAQINEAVKVIDHAADKDFRWWFMGLLVIGLMALFGLAKVGKGFLDRLSNRLDAVQDGNTKYLQDTGHKQLTVIAENSLAMNRIGQALEKIAGHLEKDGGKR
jgi:hypothetical protein